MTYFAESNYIEYDLCFESNINTVNFINYSEENEFCNFTHKKLQKISSFNLVIGSSKYKSLMIFSNFLAELMHSCVVLSLRNEFFFLKTS